MELVTQLIGHLPVRGHDWRLGRWSQGFPWGPVIRSLGYFPCGESQTDLGSLDLLYRSQGSYTLGWFRASPFSYHRAAAIHHGHPGTKGMC